MLLAEPGNLEGKDNLYLPNHGEEILTMWKCKYAILERIIRNRLNIYPVFFFKKSQIRLLLLVQVLLIEDGMGKNEGSGIMR